MTRLLVSVRNVIEADAALRGGADIIDIKEPDAGSLGKADNRIISQIISQVNAQRPVSAAMGELYQNSQIPDDFASLTWLKVGLSKQRDNAWQDKLATFYADPKQQAVAVAYADHQRAFAPCVDEVLQWAIDFSAPVFLIDTFIKDGKTLLDHVSVTQLSQLIRRAQSQNIAIALAGSLCGDVLTQVIELKPDIIAVRGAVCVNHDRSAGVDEDQVRALKTLVS